MNKHIIFKMAFLGLLLLTMGTSCLKQDLPDLPLWDGNEIILVNVEHRYNSAATINGQPIVGYQKLGVVNEIIKETATINLKITVPQPNAQFTAAEKANVSQSKLWVYMNISTAAKIAPVEATPKPGDATDLSRPLKYEIIAANGQKRIWTINVTSFVN